MKLSPETAKKLQAVIKRDELDIVRDVIAELRGSQMEEMAKCMDPTHMLREQGKVWALDKLLVKIFEKPNQ